jgi:cyclic pyranopterin phosphate synthase
MIPQTRPLVDSYGRRIDYVRLSLTDRCDLRCVYCMSEEMSFLPKADLLSFEEIERLAGVLIRRGVKKLRLTGGEPLVRKGVMDLIANLGAHVRAGDLEELTLTTNGTQLAQHAEGLAAAGVRRINVSLDSRDQATFARITRRDALAKVLEGIEAAKAAGLKVKINTVALAHDNRAELPWLIRWAHEQGFDITLIETMPLGEIEEDRTDQYVSLRDVRGDLESFWTLEDLPLRTAGPARYVRVAETGGRLGFITPLSHNFCESCNRVRVTCTGVMYMCLGQEDRIDLREPLRLSPQDDLLDAALDQAMRTKPKGHDFVIERGAAPAVSRHMSATGG